MVSFYNTAVALSALLVTISAEPTWHRDPLLKQTCDSADVYARHELAQGQNAVSQTITCSDHKACTHSFKENVSFGRMIDTAVDIWDLLSSDTGLYFQQETTKAIFGMYQRGPGTKGHLDFTAKYQCLQVKVSGCKGGPLKDGDFVNACTPTVFGMGDGATFDGELRFVQE